MDTAAAQERSIFANRCSERGTFLGRRALRCATATDRATRKSHGALNSMKMPPVDWLTAPLFDRAVCAYILTRSAISVTGAPALSVAFTKEESSETASETILPERVISAQPNLVTESGLKALEAELAVAREAYAAGNLIEDVNDKRRQTAGPARDIRYLVERIRTADLQPAPASNDIVAFGSTVRFEREDGRVQTFRIVGEDEADPKSGTVSWVSPLARVLLGKAPGDLAMLGNEELEIQKIT